jgi:hypothetical protein
VADLGNWMYQIRVSGWTSKFCSIFREAENVSSEIAEFVGLVSVDVLILSGGLRGQAPLGQREFGAAV